MSKRSKIKDSTSEEIEVPQGTLRREWIVRNVIHAVSLCSD